jgi:hypothetical protein
MLLQSPASTTTSLSCADQVLMPASDEMNVCKVSG